MAYKQTLKIDPNTAYNSDIVKILPSGSSYVDDAYFREVGKEDKDRQNYKNFPVKVMGFGIDWIIKF